MDSLLIMWYQSKYKIGRYTSTHYWKQLNNTHGFLLGVGEVPLPTLRKFNSILIGNCNYLDERMNWQILQQNWIKQIDLIDNKQCINSK